jgi:3-hydroxyisobutyrate dehydrogenase-like beta-hydroxyacid dehydrogenase
MSDEPVGFIGLGNMGGRIADCITRGGRAVVGFDVREENTRRPGMTAAATVGEVVGAADVVLLSLPDSRVVESVMEGDSGVLAHLRPGQLVVDLSTAAPDSTRRLCEAVRERGGDFLDAGISGGAAAAERGALTLMVGGAAESLDRVRPLLDLFSASVFHCGDPGAGHIAKLLNNFLNAVTLAATAEVMVAGKKAGLDLQVLLDVINASSGVSFASTNRFPKIIHGDYLEGGLTNTLMLKDVTLYVELVSALGVSSLNSAGPIASFGLARALGYADQISNRVVDAIGDISGGVRLHDVEGAHS